MERLRIPAYAKKAARDALALRFKLPPDKRFGLDKAQARALGINSGVERAKQLVREKSLGFLDASRVAAFYLRFRNRTGFRAEGSIGLWGGRRFGREAVLFVRNSRSRK